MSPYYPVALNLRDRRVLVIGSGEEAEKKTKAMLRAGARITVVAPHVGSLGESRAVTSMVHWYVRPFTPTDLCGMEIAVLTERNEELAAAVRRACRARGVWLCAIDQPKYCDWIHMGMASAGSLQVGVSSGGAAPMLVRRLRDELQRAFDDRFVRFVERIAILRANFSQASFADRKRVMEEALRGFEMKAEFCYPTWESEPSGKSRILDSIE